MKFDHAELVPRRLAGRGEAERGACNHWRERAQRRQARYGETPTHSAKAGVSGETLEVIGREPEGQASIAVAMGVAALEALSTVAEHQGAGRHQNGAERRAVLKTAGEHDRDRVARMLFFEGMIIGPRGAEHVGDRPIVIGRDRPG